MSSLLLQPLQAKTPAGLPRDSMLRLAERYGDFTPEQQQQLWLAKMIQSDGSINSVAYSPNGSQILSAGGGATLKVWEWEAGSHPNSNAAHFLL